MIGRSLKILGLVLVSLGEAIPFSSAEPGEAERITPAVVRALETGDRSRLAALFPPDRKVRVSLHRIADLEGFTGSGPLVEALCRYLAPRTNLRFDPEPFETSDTSGPVRVRGVLSSREKGGKRERVALVFIFERIDGALLAIEVRETG